MTFQYQWLICGANGDSCHDVKGATGSTYQVRTADVGNTIRVRVVATNGSGSGNETSAPTARVGSTPAPAPTGCPKLAAGAVAVNVTDIGSPARLQIDKFIPSGLITSHLSSFSVRFHVSDTCGQSVSGAAVSGGQARSFALNRIDEKIQERVSDLHTREHDSGVLV